MAAVAATTTTPPVTYEPDLSQVPSQHSNLPASRRRIPASAIINIQDSDSLAAWENDLARDATRRVVPRGAGNLQLLDETQ